MVYWFALMSLVFHVSKCLHFPAINHSLINDWACSLLIHLDSFGIVKLLSIDSMSMNWPNFWLRPIIHSTYCYSCRQQKFFA